MISIDRPQRARSASSNAVLVRGAAQPRGTDDHDRVGALRTRLVVPRADHRDRPLDRLGRQHTRRVEPFAEPRDLGPIGNGLGRTVGPAFPDEELDGVRPDVDDGVSEHAEPDQSLQAAGHVDVRASGQAEPFDRRAARAQDPAIRSRSCRCSETRSRLRFARPCTRRRRSAPAVCAPEGPAGPDSSRPTSSPNCSSVYVVRTSDGATDAQCFQHHRGLFRRERERRLEDRLPQFEAVVIDPLEMFHVGQLVAELDRRVGMHGNEVDLVALSHLVGRCSQPAPAPRARTPRRTCAIPSAARSPAQPSCGSSRVGSDRMAASAVLIVG